MKLPVCPPTGPPKSLSTTAPNWPSNRPPSGPKTLALDDIETRLQLAADEDPEVRQIVSANICRCCGRGG